MRGKSVAFVIEKGGTGKSTIAFNVGWALSKRKRILLIDLDGQKANLTYFCGVNKDNIRTITDVLNGNVELNDAIVPVKSRMDILPADNTLMEIGSPQHYGMISKQRSFRELLRRYPQLGAGNVYQLFLIRKMQELVNDACKEYDYVLLDPNPSPNYLHTLALCSSEFIVIPVLPDAASLESDEGTAESLAIIKEEGINENVRVLGVLFNRYTERTNLSKQVKEMIEEYASEMETSVFNSTIRNAVALSECVGMHMGITDYRPNSSVAADVKAVARELQRRIKNADS